MPAPILETPRLTLRAHRLDDYPALAATWADDAVTRFIGGKPSKPEESWARLLRYGGLWPLLGYGYWAVEEKKSGAYAGDVGFADFYRVMEPSIRGVPEMGWVIASQFHGQGYASEAVAVALKWFDAQGRKRSVCIIDPQNEASLKLAAKNGFSETCHATFMGDDVLLFERGK